MAANLCDGYIQRLGGFLRRHSSEEAHLDEPALQLVLARQFRQCIIDCNHHGWPVCGDVKSLIEWHFCGAATPLSGISRAGVIDQNLPHNLRGYRHEVSPALIIRLILLYQPRVGFVNQSCRLERVAGPLVAEVPSRQPPKLRIYQRYQTVEGTFVPTRKTP